MLTSAMIAARLPRGRGKVLGTQVSIMMLGASQC